MNRVKQEGARGVVAGVFADEAAAGRAVARLIDAHFDPPRDLEVVASHRRRHESVPLEERFAIDRGAVVGALTGGALGGFGALLVALGVLPGVGVLAAAPALAAVQGIVLGLAGGFAFGAVVGLGHWREESGFGGLRVHGVTWVGVRARGPRAEEARAILRDAGARHLMG